MATLTYAPGVDWAPRHISDCLRELRRFGDAHGERIAYAWVAELQKRGAVHYHVVLFIPARLYLPKFDRAGWWPHGSSNMVRARFAPGYIAKYASKVATKAGGFPLGCRLFGVGGLDAEDRATLRFERLPAWLREAGATVAHQFRRVVGGGFRSRVTSQRLRSPWECSPESDFKLGRVVMLRVREVPAVWPVEVAAGRRLRDFIAPILELAGLVRVFARC